jgi:hypothetical protein
VVRCRPAGSRARWSSRCDRAALCRTESREVFQSEGSRAVSSLASWSWHAVLSGNTESLADSGERSAVPATSSSRAAAPPTSAARPDAIRPNILASAARPAAAEAHPAIAGHSIPPRAHATRIEEVPGRGIWFEIAASVEAGRDPLEEVPGRGIWLRLTSG